MVLSLCTLSLLFRVPPKTGMRVRPDAIHQKDFKLGEAAVSGVA